MPEPLEKEIPNKRRHRRAQIATPLRVRSSEPQDAHFEDSPVSVNASKEGVYFKTRRDSYYPGMRAFVTFPFSVPSDPTNCEYVAEIVRIDELPNARFGIAVHLLMTLNNSASSSSGFSNLA